MVAGELAVRRCGSKWWFLTLPAVFRPALSRPWVVGRRPTFGGVAAGAGRTPAQRPARSAGATTGT